MSDSEKRDGERFRYFLALPISSRQRWVSLYPTARALRTAIDNAIRIGGGEPVAPKRKKA
jgi:hypothetical protein